MAEGNENKVIYTYKDLEANMDADNEVNNYQPKTPTKPRPVVATWPTPAYGSVTPYNTGTVSSFSDIAGDQYQQLIDAQRAQLDAAYNKQTGDYNSQRQKSEQDYRSLVNQAAANSAMQQRAMRESMANMGLSGAGGTSMSHTQMANNNLSNQVGSIKLQQKQYNEEVDRALADLASQYNADSLNVDASIGAQKMSDQLAYDQWKSGYELQRDQYNTAAQQWNQEFSWNTENAKLNQIIDLYRSRKISKKQFEKLTGIDI